MTCDGWKEQALVLCSLSLNLKNQISCSDVTSPHPPSFPFLADDSPQNVRAGKDLGGPRGLTSVYREGENTSGACGQGLAAKQGFPIQETGVGLLTSCTRRFAQKQSASLRCAHHSRTTLIRHSRLQGRKNTTHDAK